MQRGDNVCVHITHPLIKSSAQLRTSQPWDTVGRRGSGREGLSVVEEGAGERRRRFTEARLRKKRGAEWTDYSH